MSATRGRLAPLILVALMLMVAGCGRSAEDANSGNANDGGDAGGPAESAAGTESVDVITEEPGESERGEQDWDSLSMEEQYHATGVDLILDMARKLDRSESAKLESLDEAYAEMGSAESVEGFLASLAMPERFAADFEEREENGETVFCNIGEIGQAAEGVCIKPDKVINMALTHDQQNHTIGAEAAVVDEDDGAIATYYRLSASGVYKASSSLATCATPAEVARSLEQTRGEDLTVSSLSAPGIIHNDANYSFTLGPSGTLEPSHDPAIMQLNTNASEYEHLNHLMHRMGEEKSNTYGLTEGDVDAAGIE